MQLHIETERKESDSMERYDRLIRYLEEVPLYGHKDGTKNIAYLMDLLTGDLQKALKDTRVIHVAGTNGKGSTCAMLSSILRSAGLKTGLYTSPHLMSYTERIQINGRPISQTDFVRMGAKVKRAISQMVAQGKNHPTFFEILTAMGLCYFLEKKVDVIVLETGVGGRLDATNIIDHPDLCMITSISLDHTKVLGSTVEAIAKEKAGILRKGSPVVVAKNLPRVQRVLREEAGKAGAPYHYAGSAADLAKAAGYEIPLKGRYQKENLAAVLEGAALLSKAGLAISGEALRKGLKETSWPGRMQALSLYGCEVILDGAHNPAGAKALSEYIEAEETQPVVLVFSALGKKDIEGILGPLRDASKIRSVIFTCIDGQDETARFIEAWGKRKDAAPYQIIKEPGEALLRATKAARQAGGKVYVAGSLYLIGDILTFWQQYTEVQDV